MSHRSLSTPRMGRRTRISNGARKVDRKIRTWAIKKILNNRTMTRSGSSLDRNTLSLGRPIIDDGDKRLDPLRLLLHLLCCLRPAGEGEATFESTRAVSAGKRLRVDVLDIVLHHRVNRVPDLPSSANGSVVYPMLAHVKTGLVVPCRAGFSKRARTKTKRIRR